MDFEKLTAPCGLPCFECIVYLAGYSDELKKLVATVLQIPEENCVCQGCRAEKGMCGPLPVSCHVYPCAQEKKVLTCGDCEDFPCDYLHPYADQALKPHNTKVFNLCLIKKMGLKKWAEEKAEKVIDTYHYEKWRL
ncbi:MAG: DUF3795 domain-containing protein [Thermoplasmata archaeon]|nr:MAG: DUF3795 domain-containing protein [Thermoplasmata archaeon]